MFFLIVPVLGDIGEHAFGRFARARCLMGGHEVVRFAKFAVVFRLGDGVNVIHDVMGNNGIKRAGLVAEEEAGEVEGFFIKAPIVGISVCHPVGLDVLRHDLASPAPRNFDRPSGLHLGSIERTFFRIVGGSEQGRVVVDLADNHIALKENLSVWVANDVTDVINKVFVKRNSFSVKDNNVFLHGVLLLLFMP